MPKTEEFLIETADRCTGLAREGRELIERLEAMRNDLMAKAVEHHASEGEEERRFERGLSALDLLSILKTRRLRRVFALLRSHAAPLSGSPPCGGGMGAPSAAYSLSLLRSVRIEMPRMLAA
jgi:hypothetical protein